MNKRLLGAIRIMLGLSWLYHGLWMKLILVAPHHLAVVEGLGPVGGLTPRALLFVIGTGESLLGLGAVSGWCPRFVAWFQIGLVVAMNAIGILAGRGAITDPAALVVGNLPFIACALVVAMEGAGAWVWRRSRT
jgi:uncharacterized membrane protein YphA (DoxX/SURF4 family)